MTADSEVTAGSETFLVATPFATPARLLSVRTFGTTTGSCSGEVSITNGSCTTTGSLKDFAFPLAVIVGKSMS